MRLPVPDGAEMISSALEMPWEELSARSVIDAGGAAFCAAPCAMYTSISAFSAPVLMPETDTEVPATAAAGMNETWANGVVALGF